MSFEQATQIFHFPVLENVDPRSYGEQRFVAVGHDQNGMYFVVVSTWRGEDRRIISAWRAGRHDTEAYRVKIRAV